MSADVVRLVLPVPVDAVDWHRAGQVQVAGAEGTLFRLQLNGHEVDFVQLGGF